MKIKVLFFVSTLESGGPTNVIYNIIKYIDRNLIEPSILTLSRERTKTRKEDFERLGVKVYSFNRSRIYWMISDMKELKDLIDQISPDIIHSHSLRPDVSSAKHFRFYTKIATIHSDLDSNYKDTYGRIMGYYFARIQLRSIRKMDYAVACSISVFDLYKTSIKNISVIQNGIDEDIFYSLTPEEIKRKKTELNLPIDKKIIITVGSLIKRKDPITILEAFVNSERFKDSVLLILGTGPLERILQDKYPDKERIMFVGFTNKTASYLQCADLFVSASISEGLPNSVMEALGCGLPVCLSDIPSHQEILTIHKQAGKFFTNHKELTDAFNEIFKENYSISRDFAVRIIKDKLNAREMSLAYQKLYISLYQNKKEMAFNKT